MTRTRYVVILVLGSLFAAIRCRPAPEKSSLVRELSNQQRERLGVSADAERSGVHRLESDVADQPHRDILGT